MRNSCKSMPFRYGKGNTRKNRYESCKWCLLDSGNWEVVGAKVCTTISYYNRYITIWLFKTIDLHKNKGKVLKMGQILFYLESSNAFKEQYSWARRIFPGKLISEIQYQNSRSQYQKKSITTTYEQTEFFHTILSIKIIFIKFSRHFPKFLSKIEIKNDSL